MNVEHHHCLKILKKCLKEAGVHVPVCGDDVKKHLDVIISNSEKKKAVLAVTVTSLTKKAVDPQQDIRRHQSGLDGGYSGRTLDTKTVTPFLKANQFPAMSESGWLTRSLEQNQPYTLDYKGSVTPHKLKQAFLCTLDRVQNHDESPIELLTYLLSGLIKQRDENTKLRLAKPVDLPIRTIMSYLNKHFMSQYSSAGGSRLPVLAIYAAYQQMISEVGRYRKHVLKQLESHTSPDRRSGATGDIEVADEQSKIFEAVEVKHRIRITPSLVREAHMKFKSEPIKRYYLLTTDEQDQNSEEITAEVVKISQIHGCQVIVNGVMNTLKYYLRLLKTPDDFVHNYVRLIEKDESVKFEHRQRWNDIVQNQGA